MEPLIFKSKAELGKKAADWVAGRLCDVIRVKGHARLILATGASQFEFLGAFVDLSIDWSKIECFHLDEYLGIDDHHPASFRKYLQDRVWNKVKIGKIHKLDPAKLQEYAAELQKDEIDLACIGIGENGHIAFNDPPVADFADPELVKIVELDEECRLQQVGEGWFPDLESTPTHAATLTIPAIMQCKALSVVVPGHRKAKAVKDAIEGPLSTDCPASVLRKHGDIVLWLDEAAASLLGKEKCLQEVSELPIPGLVDLQVNGFDGVDFSSIRLTRDQCRTTFQKILKTGIFLFLPTVITSSLDTYKHVLPILSDVMNEDEFVKHVPGIHLEGPFISSKEGFRGAHPKQHVCKADIRFFQVLFGLAKEKVTMVTMAAELEGAKALCEFISSLGIVVSLGHQDARPNDLASLVMTGAKMLTHLGNGMPSVVDRHYNQILVGLSEPRLAPAVIADGYHLPNHVLRVILSHHHGAVLVSDMAPPTGKLPGDYQLGETKVTLESSGRLTLTENPHILGGSAVTLVDAATYLLTNKLATSEDITRLAFINPLKVLGWTKSMIDEILQNQILN